MVLAVFWQSALLSLLWEKVISLVLFDCSSDRAQDCSCRNENLQSCMDYRSSQKLKCVFLKVIFSLLILGHGGSTPPV